MIEDKNIEYYIKKYIRNLICYLYLFLKKKYLYIYIKKKAKDRSSVSWCLEN